MKEGLHLTGLPQKFKENNSSKTINNFKNFKNEKVYILIFYVSRFSFNFLRKR